MSTNPKSRAWVEVQADALRANYARIVAAVGPEVRVMPMVKADAYGLGVHDVVRRLDPFDPWGYGVATVDEGVALRAAGVTRPIVVTAPTPRHALDEAVRHDLQLAISGLAALRECADAARRSGRVVGVHLDVDTGMGRSGFDWRTAASWLPELSECGASIRWVGCQTHLHSADEDEGSVLEQLDRLGDVLGQAEELPEDLVVHVLNSAGAFRVPTRAEAMIRPGLFLYGGVVGRGLPTPDPVVALRARVVHVREAEPGTTVGYGATYTALAEERWATLSIGYGDGVPRALGNRGRAIVGGVHVPIVGRISMDVTVVDITGAPAVDEGSVATLVGEVGGERITLEEFADAADTNAYEILTGLTPRLPRVWSDCGPATATRSRDPAIP